MESTIKSEKMLRVQPGFGERLRAVREKHGLSLQGFGNAVSYHKSYINRLESGENRNPSTDFLVKVGDTFGVSPEWLRTGKGEMIVAHATIPPPWGNRLEEETQLTVALRIAAEVLPEDVLQTYLERLFSEPQLSDKARLFVARSLRAWAGARQTEKNLASPTLTPQQVREGAHALEGILRSITVQDAITGRIDARIRDFFEPFRKPDGTIAVLPEHAVLAVKSGIPIERICLRTFDDKGNEMIDHPTQDEFNYLGEWRDHFLKMLSKGQGNEPKAPRVGRISGKQ
jgi:transcriptional regulator with XRE-family HTH domain